MPGTNSPTDTMKSRYDVIVIGAGHNGLVAAARLAGRGLQVLVLERRPLVGGACVTEEIFPGYRVSTAAYLVSLLQQRIVDELDLHRFGYEVDPKDPAFFSLYPDGRTLTMWQDQDRTVEEIARFSKKDAEAYPRYCEYVDRLARIVEPLLFVTPPDVPPASLKGWVDTLKLAGRFRDLGAADWEGLIKIFSQSAHEFLCEWFESEADAGDVGDRWGDRGERRADVAGHGVRPAASLHGRRRRRARPVGIRSRRHGGGDRGDGGLGAGSWG